MDSRTTTGAFGIGSAALVTCFMVFGRAGRYAAIQHLSSSSDSNYEWHDDPNTPGMRVGVLTRKTSTPKPVRNTRPLTKAEAASEKGQWHLERKEWDDAIKQFSEVLRLEPKNADAFYNRGAAKMYKGELDEALTDFDAALRLQPKDVDALLDRAAIRLHQNQPRAALVDLDAALGIDPENVDAYCARGKVREDEGEYRLALYDYQNATRRESDNPAALNYLAWLLATAPDAAIRDGQRALEAALSAVKLEQAKEWDSIDTLAAAFAETGKFAEAVRSQQEALRLAPADVQDELKSRLQLYQSHQPYRLSPNTTNSTTDAPPVK